MPTEHAIGEGRPPISVLTVDDQAIFRSVAREVIEATPGFTAIGEVASGPEALTASGALRPDLVLLDVRMPGMDGIETARRLREARPDAVVVLVSMEEMADVDTTTETCGAAAFVRKQDLCPALLRSVLTTYPRR